MIDDSATNAYRAISEYYDGARAKRSLMPYMKHIDEGLAILDELGADEVTKDAFCIHPMIQSNDDLLITYKDSLLSDYNIEAEVILLAFRYREIANSFLSKHIDNISRADIFTIKKNLVEWPEVQNMLIADKVQNKFDFMVHHYERHEKSDKLLDYFNRWLIDILQVDYHKLARHCEYLVVTPEQVHGI